MTIKQIIYDTLEKENVQYIPKAHNPSSASFKMSDGKIIGKDLLTLYYKWTKVKPSNPALAPALLKMRLGDGVHEVLSKILTKAGIKAMSEVAGKTSIVGLTYPVSYRVDGLQEIDGHLEVLEVKSVDEEQLLGHGWGIVDKGPKQEHVLQVICYLNLVPGVTKARLLYIARDTGLMEEFIIERKSDTYFINQNISSLNFTGIVQRWKEFEFYLAQQKEPLPEFKVWLNPENEFMKVKQIKGERFKSQWEALYSPYADLIYKNSKNYQTATFNYIFEKEGIEGIKKYVI